MRVKHILVYRESLTVIQHRYFSISQTESFLTGQGFLYPNVICVIKAGDCQDVRASGRKFWEFSADVPHLDY